MDDSEKKYLKIENGYFDAERLILANFGNSLATGLSFQRQMETIESYSE